MNYLYYFKDSLIDILAERVRRDFNIQKDNARFLIIHSTKLAKDFFKYDFTVNSIIFSIGQRTGLFLHPDDLRKCNNVDDILKCMKKADDDWKWLMEEREKLVNGFITKYGTKKN